MAENIAVAGKQPLPASLFPYSAICQQPTCAANGSACVGTDATNAIHDPSANANSKRPRWSTPLGFARTPTTAARGASHCSSYAVVVCQSFARSARTTTLRSVNATADLVAGKRAAL